ncbi:hypothetical protein TNCV_4467051 [Trichonephila clavipes]|nr:hypothetical protein TNCV_4467051 [Trichonephila clavipes]
MPLDQNDHSSPEAITGSYRYHHYILPNSELVDRFNGIVVTERVCVVAVESMGLTALIAVSCGSDDFGCSCSW